MSVRYKACCTSTLTIAKLSRTRTTNLKAGGIGHHFLEQLAGKSFCRPISIFVPISSANCACRPFFRSIRTLTKRTINRAVEA